MITLMLHWWYGAGWAEAWKAVSRRPAATARAFSVPILLKTLFAPWRRIVAPPARSLDAKLRAGVDNLVSRVIGFTVRFFVLLAAGLLALASFIVSLVLAVAWPLLPALALYYLVRGVIG